MIFRKNVDVMKEALDEAAAEVKANKKKEKKKKRKAEDGEDAPAGKCLTLSELKFKILFTRWKVKIRVKFEKLRKINCNLNFLVS